MLDTITDGLLLFVIVLGPPLLLMCLLDWICEHFISEKILNKISTLLFGVSSDDFQDDEDEDE